MDLITCFSVIPIGIMIHIWKGEITCMFCCDALLICIALSREIWEYNIM